MARYQVGEDVTVRMPRGKNKRGVTGISVMYTTSPEAKFDGATGSVTEINPRGPHGTPLYLVDFRDHKNRTTIPWQAQWFREEWIVRAGDPEDAASKVQVAAGLGETGLKGAAGQAQTSEPGRSS